MEKGSVDSPLCWTPWVLFFKQVGALMQRLCRSTKGVGEYSGPLERPPFPPWLSGHSDPFECHLSSPLLLACLWGSSVLLPCVCTVHGSFQLTHFVGVITQIRRSEITASGDSQSFRSAGLLSDSTRLLCSGHNRSVPGFQLILPLTCYLNSQCANFIRSIGSYLRAQCLNMYIKLSRSWQ